MIRILKKSYFTLLELLIVLFIISFGIILTGVKIKEVYQEQRFLSEAQQVLSHLAMAQDLMLIMDSDVYVKIAEDPETKKPHVWLEVEKPLEPAWARLIERKLPLTAIQSYEFGKNSDKNLTLQFSLGKMSQGTLILWEGKQDDAHRSDHRKFEIELVGYPSPLGTQKIDTKEPKSQELYPKDVYGKLYPDSP